MALPPVSAGAVKVTIAWRTPTLVLATTPVGAVGAPVGVTALESGDAAPAPAALLAVTVKM